MRYLSILLGASALVAPAIAQTWTACNPMNETVGTCPNNPGFGIDHHFQFNSSKTVDLSFNSTAGSLKYGSDGAEFIVSKRFESPTIQSYFYIMFGSVSVVMKAAKGQGIVSSIVLQSEDLDEIDWEFLGGNGTHAQTNFFGKGNTTSYDRDEWHLVDGDLREEFHNYTVDWTKEKMDFYIDSKLVRTLMYGDAKANGGKNYPQTPATVRLGIWAGGDKDNNKYTIEWAGGVTNYDDGPYTMYVQSTSVRDYGTGKEYEWTDQTGSWESIKSTEGNSTAAMAILKAQTPEKSINEKFQELPQGSKLAIYCGGGAAAALVLSALLFTCIRQRRKGRAERDAYNAKVEKEREDAYKDQMELREKGLGGWDKGSHVTQGEDALGGWGAPRSAADAPPPVPKLPANVSVHELPGRVNSPVSRHGTPDWNGGNAGGMIHNAHNAYTGGYGGSQNIPRSPNFPLGSQGGMPSHRGFPSSNGGYHRF